MAITVIARLSASPGVTYQPRWIIQALALNLCRVECFLENISFYMFCHSPTLRWRTYLKSLVANDNDPSLQWPISTIYNRVPLQRAILYPDTARSTSMSVAEHKLYYKLTKDTPYLAYKGKARYGVSIVRFSAEIDHVITASHCTCRQYHGRCWPANTRGQGNSSHYIDLILDEHS